MENSLNRETNRDVPIRIAEVINRMDNGGIESVVMNYYRHVDRSKFQFDFYFEEGSTCPQEKELIALGAGIKRIPAYSRVSRYQKVLCTAFKENQYSVVHAHLSTMSVFPLFAAWRAGVPVRICHAHSTANWGEGKKTLLKYILRPFNKIFATHWFACGEKAGQWMYGEKAVNSGKVVVIPNAIDTCKYKYSEDARRELREKLKIPKESFVVGHVGRFMYQKNHEFLIRLYAELHAIKPDARLLLVGEGELETDVRRLVSELNLEESVVFAGVQQNMGACYSAMDVFCLPSNYEGMPVVAWEAQANGLPCVLSDSISQEAVIAENTVQISLKDPVSVWVRKILKAYRAEVAPIPDINRVAAKLEQAYLGSMN